MVAFRSNLVLHLFLFCEVLWCETFLSQRQPISSIKLHGVDTTRKENCRGLECWWKPFLCSSSANPQGPPAAEHCRRLQFCWLRPLLLSVLCLHSLKVLEKSHGMKHLSLLGCNHSVGWSSYKTSFEFFQLTWAAASIHCKTSTIPPTSSSSSSAAHCRRLIFL